MSSEEVFEKVKGIIVEQLGVTEDTVTMEASFIDDLGADSLDVVEFLIELEDKFNVSFDSEDTKNIKTVGELINLITSQIK